jgi:very-short-patch-repair endonuclease
VSSFSFRRPSSADVAPATGRVTVSARTMRDAVSEALKWYRRVDLEVVLPDELGLTWADDSSLPQDVEYKQHVIDGYTVGWNVAELAALGRRIVRDTEVPETSTSALESLLAAYDAGGGVATSTKNLIFAANGPKPELVLVDSLNNDIEIVRNAEHCLVYDRPTGPTGLRMTHLVAWWREQGGHHETVSDRDVARDLYYRLRDSLGGNPVELAVFNAYQKRYLADLDTPALIPQVYLHYDPYDAAQHARRSEPQPLARQRMDFLILFSDRQRVVIEVDGRQHYADDNGRASTSRYAEMVAEDRRLRLSGYEVYRFGGHELQDPRRAGEMLDKFFEDLALKMK